MVEDYLLILAADIIPYIVKSMDSRIKLSPTLLSLICDYEHCIEQGKSLYLDDKEFHHIISYYEDELELDRALHTTEYAIKQYAYRSDFRSLKIRILIKKGLFDSAMESIESAELISPYEIELQLLKVNVYILQKKYDEAIILIEDIKKYCTKTELQDVHVAEAFFYESILEYDQMFQCLKKALIINPNHEEALLLMNESVDHSKHYEESILLHKIIIDNHPYNHLGWYNLGSAYGCVGEYTKAIDALEYSFIINPRFEAGYHDCAEYLVELKKYGRALEIYKDALEIFGPEFDILMNMANCQFELKQIDQAKRSLFKALEIDTYGDEALFLLAKCYMVNKDYNSAVKVLKKAISIENGLEEYFHALGQAYNMLDKHDKADYYYNRAAENGLEISTYWEDYICFLIEREKFSQAKRIIKRADKFTFSYRLQYLDAACHILLGSKQQGYNMLEEALIESYEDHVILNELSTQITQDSKVASMISYFEKENN